MKAIIISTIIVFAILFFLTIYAVISMSRREEELSEHMNIPKNRKAED